MQWGCGGGHTHERYGIPQACNLCVRRIKGRVGCDAIWKRHKICGKEVAERVPPNTLEYWENASQEHLLCLSTSPGIVAYGSKGILSLSPLFP